MWGQRLDILNKHTMLLTFNPACAGSCRQQTDQWAITFLLLHVYLLADGPGFQSDGVFLELVKSIHLCRGSGHYHDQRLFVSYYFHDHRQFESSRLCKNLIEALLFPQYESGDFQGWLSSLPDEKIQLQLILVKP